MGWGSFGLENNPIVLIGFHFLYQVQNIKHVTSTKMELLCQCYCESESDHLVCKPFVSCKSLHLTTAMAHGVVFTSHRKIQIGSSFISLENNMTKQ